MEKYRFTSPTSCFHRWRILAIASGLAVISQFFPSALVAAESIPVIGYLSRGSPTQPDVCLKIFREGLTARGLADGTHYRFLVRYAEQREDKLESAARALIAAKPTLLVGSGVTSLLTMKQLAPETPIISAGCGNMVSLGMIKSLAAPGGMITGISIGEIQHGIKPLNLMRQAFPNVRKLGLILDPANQALVRWMEAIRKGQTELNGFQLFPVYAVTPTEIEQAFTGFSKQGIRHANIPASWRDLSKAWAYSSNKHRVATMAFGTTFVDAGGLMEVGLLPEERCQRVPRYIELILKGAKPGDIPVEEVGNYVFSVNLKTAKKLGVRLPRELILRADRIVE